VITYVDLALRALTFSTLAITVFLAVRRFGLQRESATFLRVLVAAKEVARSGGIALASVTIKLDNLGQTRIDALANVGRTVFFTTTDGINSSMRAL
jgi:hypothetical protein